MKMTVGRASVPAILKFSSIVVSPCGSWTVSLRRRKSWAAKKISSWMERFFCFTRRLY